MTREQSVGFVGVGAMGGPMVRCLGRSGRHVVVNNVLSAIGLAAAGEVIEVGRRFGLGPEVMLDVVNHSTGRNHTTENKIAQFVLNERFDSGFALRLMVEDLAIATGLAAETGVPAPIAHACAEAWRKAAALLPPDADHTLMAALPRLTVPQRAQ